MSEYLATYPEMPHLQIDPEEPSSAHQKIAEAMQSYIETLQNGNRKRFREIESLSEKINEVCWAWAQDPMTWSAAVELRSLHVVRKLEDTVVHEDETDRNYKLPMLDEYWRKVDERTYANLGKLITEQTGMIIPEFETISGCPDHAICAMDDYVIARKCEADQYMVSYTAVPIEQ